MSNDSCEELDTLIQEVIELRSIAQNVGHMTQNEYEVNSTRCKGGFDAMVEESDYGRITEITHQPVALYFTEKSNFLKSISEQLRIFAPSMSPQGVESIPNQSLIFKNKSLEDMQNVSHVSLSCDADDQDRSTNFSIADKDMSDFKFMSLPTTANTSILHKQNGDCKSSLDLIKENELNKLNLRMEAMKSSLSKTTMALFNSAVGVEDKINDINNCVKDAECQCLLQQQLHYLYIQVTKCEKLLKERSEELTFCINNPNGSDNVNMQELLSAEQLKEELLDETNSLKSDLQMTLHSINNSKKIKECKKEVVTLDGSIKRLLANIRSRFGESIIKNSPKSKFTSESLIHKTSTKSTFELQSHNSLSCENSSVWKSYKELCEVKKHSETNFLQSRIGNLEQEVEELHQACSEKDILLKQMQKDVANIYENFANSSEKLEEAKNKIQMYQQSIKDNLAVISDQKEQLILLNKTVESLSDAHHQEINILNLKITELETNLNENMKNIRRKEEDIAMLKDNNVHGSAEVDSFKIANAELNNKIDELQKKMEVLTSNLEEENARASDLRQKLQDSQKTIAELENQLSGKSQELKDKLVNLNDLKKLLQKKERSESQVNEEIIKLKRILKEKNNLIKNLQDCKNQMEKERSNVEPKMPQLDGGSIGDSKTLSTSQNHNKYTVMLKVLRDQYNKLQKELEILGAESQKHKNRSMLLEWQNQELQFFIEKSEGEKKILHDEVDRCKCIQKCCMAEFHNLQSICRSKYSKSSHYKQLTEIMDINKEKEQVYLHDIEKLTIELDRVRQYYQAQMKSLTKSYKKHGLHNTQTVKMKSKCYKEASSTLSTTDSQSKSERVSDSSSEDSYSSYDTSYDYYNYDEADNSSYTSSSMTGPVPSLQSRQSK